MWKFNNTDELFVLKNNNEIYHSDTYLGKDFSDGIKHWKYIRRERRNGRWVYFYKNDVDQKMRNDMSNYHTNMNYYNRMTKYAKDDAEKALNSGNYKKYSDYTLKKGEYSTKANEEERKYNAAKEQYNKYRKKTAVSRTVSKLTAAVLNMASASVYKGKNILKKVFKWK